VVPILYEVFAWLDVPDDLRMPLCAGTSLALIIPTSIASFTTHRKATSIDVALLRRWILPVIVGGLAGPVVARHAPAALFKLVFVQIALATAARLIFPDRLPKLG